MSKQFNTRIQHKIDTYENWNKAENFIPLLGELIIYTTDENGNANTQFKIGDGESYVKDLDFAVAGSATGEAGFAQSDWAQTNTQAADYIKNKPGDEYDTKKTIFLTDSIIIPEASTNTFPGFYASQIFYETDKKLQNGDMITFTTLLDNISLSSQLIVDEALDEAFGMASYQTGYFATFNTLENILEAVQAGLPKTDENIPYSFGIVLVYEGDNDYSLVIVSPRNDLSHREVKIEINRAETGYIKLSNNALDIDLEPIEGSKNLITSGGVAAALKNIDISNNNVQSDWLETDISNGGYIKNKPGDEIEEEEIINFVENYQLQEGQEVAPSVFTFGTIFGETTPQIGEKVRMFVKTSDNENIFIGEETLYHDAILQETMGGTNDGPWACCTINSTVKNAAEAIQTGNLPIANETIPYAFAIVIVPDGRGGGYITIASTENLAGLNITLQKVKINLTTIKLANNALNIDNEVIEGSNNLITSNAAYKALLNNINKLPEIIDTVGISELDNAIISGVYKYIADNGLECILFISERIKNEQKNITQLLIKTTSNNDLSNDDLGRGLIGRGAFIRTGIAINDEVLWENDGKFSNIHDLPQAPSAIGYYVLNSDKNENNESLYTWTELSEGPMEGILNQVSTWLGSQLENVAYTNSINTFNNNQTINGNLTINGNIIQEGDNYITHAEHVYTEDDYIILRKGAESGLAPVIPGDATQTGQFAGFEAKNYDGTNDGRLVFDNTGTARVGDIGEEEPLTTRAEANEIVEGTLATWGLKNGAPVLTSGLSIIILTQNEYDSIVKDNNTLYLIKEG